jgi:ABC-type polysaccharide/polyol phosphate export permease
MGSYLAAIWRCRFFWLSLVKMDLRTRYRRSVLGMGWSLLHPIAMTVILCVVFCRLFHKSVHEYAPFLMAGLACWNYILTVTVQGCHCLFQGEAYIRQYPAPIAIYPLRNALGGIIHFLIALAVVVALAVGLNGIHHPLALLSLVPTIVLLFLFGWAMSVLAGFANVYFQDTQHLCEVFFQILFYVTPIIYEPAMLKDRGMSWLVDWNPLVPLLDLVRDAILQPGGKVPTAGMFGFASLIVLAVCGAAALTLTRFQRKLIFRL